MQKGIRHMRVWKKIQPDSLIKKCIYGFCIVIFLMIPVINIVTQETMFQLLKPELQKNYSVLTGAVSTKISYILHQNSQYILNFWNDDELMEQAVAYASWQKQGKEDTSEAIACKEEIMEKMVIEKIGDTQPGAIVSSRNIFFVVDNACVLGNEKLQNYIEQIMQSGWYSKLADVFERLSYTDEKDGLERCYSPVFSETSNTEEFISFAVPYKTGEHTIYLIMIEPFSDIKEIFHDFEQVNLNDFCLLGYQNEILFKNRADSFIDHISESERDILADELQYAVKITEEEQHTILVSRASYQMDQIKVAVGITAEEYLTPFRAVIQKVSITILIFVVLIAVFIILILKRQLNPLKELSGQMKQVQKGDYKIENKICINDEIGSVASAFYCMMDEIQKNITSIREHEKREKRIEYSLLLSQIDPHFIYNTLNTSTYLAKLNRTKDITILNKALINMLRDRLRMSQLQIYGTVEEEKAQIDSYMAIQGYLCHSPICYEFYIESGTEKLCYPKNMLQPLVENSILHGILLNKKEDGTLIPGKIRISISSDAHRIITEIDDNGLGMTREQILHYFEEEPETQMGSLDADCGKREHIGIYNIRTRLKYLYGDLFCLCVLQSDLGGVKIRLVFPLKKEEKEN